MSSYSSAAKKFDVFEMSTPTDVAVENGGNIVTDVVNIPNVAIDGPTPFPEHPQTSYRLHCSVTYLLRATGSFKIIQCMCSVIALMCILTTTYHGRKYNDLPKHTRLQLFSFLSISSVIFCVVFLLVHSIGMTKPRPFEWIKTDFIACLMFAGSFAVLSGLVMDAAIYFDKHYPDWTAVQAVDSAVFGYLTMLAYFGGAYYAWRDWRGNRQFRLRRFENPDDDNLMVTDVDTNYTRFT